MPIPFWSKEGVAEAFGTKQGATSDGAIFSTDPWDVATLAGKKLPGICKVDGAPTLAFEKKKQGGVDGAIITVNGYLPGPIEIECTIWHEAQWTYLQSVAPELWTKPNKKKTKGSELARPIYHPALALWGINNAVVIGVTPPKDGPVPDTKVIKFKCLEWVAVTNDNKTKTVKPSAVVPLAPQYNPARNKVPPKPSTTAVQPGGEPPNRKGGVS